ncbi:MAG: CpaF family protein, partial [Phreatobacter sp.]|nr:CpaF family protein [Phreatobacter sp.]
MFGKRGNSGSGIGRQAPPGVGTLERAPSPASVRAAEPPRAAIASPPIAPVAAQVEDRQRSSSFYETKSQVFGALIEAIDLSQLAKL